MITVVNPGASGSGIDSNVAPLRLAFLADTGAQTEGLLNGADSPLADLLHSWEVEKILLAGDCRYSPASYATAKAFLRDRLADTIACPGNHDLDPDGGAAFYAAFPRPDPWPETSLPGCYHVPLRDGLGDIIVINDGLKSNGTQMHNGGVGNGSPLQQWFASVCAELTGKTRLVLIHHPSFAPTTGPSEHIPQLDWLTDPQYRIDAILHGHNHISWVGSVRGTRMINASATARLDNSALTLQGSGNLQWIETDSPAACLLTLSAQGFQFEFYRSDAALIYAGGAEPIVLPSVLDTDVIAPGTSVTDGDHYVTHAPAAYFLDAIRVSMAGAGRSITASLMAGNAVLVPPTVLSATSNRVACRPAKLIAPGTRLTLRISGAGNTYSGPTPPRGIRLAQQIRPLS